MNLPAISRRRLLGISGGLAAAATLTACGSNTLDSSESPAANSGGDATLTQWYHEYGEDGVREAVEGYAADYAAASVTVEWMIGDNYMTTLASQLLTNDVPDVFEAEQGGTLAMIQGEQLADLTDLMSDSIDQFNPAVIERFTFEDKIYSVPQTIDMQLLYYRPSVLEAAGVSVPTNFEELAAAANAVKTSDMGGFFAGNDGGVGVLATMFIWASGHEQLNADRTEAAFLTDDFYAALVAYRDFLASGGVLEAASAEWYDPDAFVNGEAAMQWGGLWSLPQIQEAHGDDVGVLAFPAMGSNGRAAVPFGAFGSCAAAAGPNVEAAKEFIKWLWIDQEDKQLDFSDSYGTHIPAKPALAAKASKLAEGPGAEASQFVADSGFANDIMWSGTIGEAYNAAVISVIKQNTDPADAFADFGALVSSELEQLKS